MKFDFKFLLFFFFGWIGVSSCGNPAEAHSNMDPSVNDVGVLAIVTTEFARDGCASLLEIQENGEKVLLLPINFDKKYIINGLKLRIRFHSSRIKQGVCQKGRPVVLDRVNFVE